MTRLIGIKAPDPPLPESKKEGRMRMTQGRRRTIFWCIVATLLIVGALLQARAGNKMGSAATQSLSLKTDPNGKGYVTEEEALLQGLTCAVAVIAVELPLAERECARAIEISPQEPIGYKYRGIAYLLQHRFERAEMDLKEAARLDPQDADSQAGYAQALSGQGRFGEAVTRFDVALKLSPKDARYLSARCWARGGEGKDFTAALSDCNRAIQLKPRYAVAYDSRAFVYLRQGKNAQAIKDYSAALQFQPGRATALLGRGVAEYHLAQTAQAASDIREARKIDPEVDDIYILGGVLQESCRSKEGPCDLPVWLRPRPFAAKTFLSVSYRAPAR
jgi:tetratricopeptide (TPR) repeat protein